MSTSTLNPFDLLGDDDSGDISQLLAAAAQKAAAAAAAAVPKETENAPSGKGAAKLPSKPLPPAQAVCNSLGYISSSLVKRLPPVQAVREAKTETGRRGGRGGDRGGYGGDRGGYGGDRGNARVGGGGGGGYNRDQPKENSFRNSGFSGGQGSNEEADGGKSFEKRGGYNGPPRNSYRGPRRGESENGEVGNEEKPRRHYERRSGTGRGYEVKREGAGRGNWGTANDEITQETAEVVNETEKIVDAEKPSGEEAATDVTKETPATEAEVKDPEPEEDKEMTLQEYEKVLEEKRKALQALKTTEERKVDDKAFASMQALANKRDNDEVFAKLGSDKRKELAEKEEKAKKTPVSINEFLKPAEGERYYGGGGGRRGGRGGSRGGRGPREGSSYGGGARTSYHANAPKIEDPSQFPVLGAK